MPCGFYPLTRSFNLSYVGRHGRQKFPIYVDGPAQKGK